MPSHLSTPVRVALFSLLAATACSDGPDRMTDPVSDPQALFQGGHAPVGGSQPAPLATFPVGGEILTAFGYATDDLSSNGRDPINLVFAGESDPRHIRAALLGLDGDRTGSPLAPFDCTWKDAIGGLQAAWGGDEGWVGSAIQLECGEYGPVRFHLRFFDIGDATLGSAHFEFLIPGTTDHQVVSWELAEQLVTFDLARTGLLGAAPTSSGSINNAPWFRTIPGFLYTLAVQADPQFGALLGMLGLIDLAGGDKGIPTDGAATVLTLAAAAALVPGEAHQDFEVPFGQVIPKPFCLDGAPSPYLYVTGPVRLRLASVQHANGQFSQRMTAAGTLALTPVNPATGQPVGEPYAADVSEFQDADIGQRGTTIQGMQLQVELPSGLPGRGQVQIKLKVGESGAPQYSRREVCGGQ